MDLFCKTCGLKSNEGIFTDFKVIYDNPEKYLSEVSKKMTKGNMFLLLYLYNIC